MNQNNPPHRALALVCMLFAVGCGDEKPKQEPIKSPIVIGLPRDYGEFDSASDLSISTSELLVNIGDPLMAFEPGTTTLVPRVASGDPIISADGLRYTFRLRDNVTFADGTPVNAQAFKYAIDRMGMLGDNFLVSDYIDHMEAPDALTLTFVLQHPIGYFTSLVPSYLAVNRSYPEDKIVSPYVPTTDLSSWQTGHVDQATFNVSQIFGYGQYRIDAIAFDKTKDDYTQIDLSANPTYWGTPPRSERVTLKIFDNSDSLYTAFLNHEIDVIPRGLTATQITALRADTVNFQMFENPGRARVLLLNTASAPFHSKDVRQAIAAAIDRQAITAGVFWGNARPLYSMIPEGLWSHTDAFKTKYGTRNLALAVTLLGNAGYTTTSKLNFELWYDDTSIEPGLPEALKTALEETGLIEVTFKHSDDVGPGGASQGLYESRLAYVSADYIDPDNYLVPFGHSNVSNQYGVFYNDSALDSVLDAAATTTDFSQRKALYQQAQDDWADGVPTIPLVQLSGYVAAQNNISLTAPGIDFMFFFGTISRD